MFTFVVLRCITPRTSASEINEWKIQLQAPSSGETWECTRRATLTVHYGDSLAVKCTSIVHSFLRCIVGFNECTRQRPLKMAVPSNSALFAIQPIALTCIHHRLRHAVFLVRCMLEWCEHARAFTNSLSQRIRKIIWIIFSAINTINSALHLTQTCCIPPERTAAVTHRHLD